MQAQYYFRVFVRFVKFLWGPVGAWNKLSNSATDLVLKPPQPAQCPKSTGKMKRRYRLPSDRHRHLLIQLSLLVVFMYE